MKCTIALCVLLLSLAGAMADGNFLPGGLTDAMSKAAGTAQQAMGGGANPLQQMMGGGNPFGKVMEDAKKMMESGGGDSVQQMQAMLEKGMQEATNGDVQKQFQEALTKVKSMAEEGLPQKEIMEAVSQMQQG